MKIADLIAREHVITDLRCNDKAQVLGELSRRASAALSIDQDTILKALRAREDLGSTGLGKGFALPHARMEQVPRFFALFARLARPIDFGSIDDRPVDLVVLLLIPAKAGNEHLATLAAISRPLRDAAFVKQLREAERRSAAPAAGERLTSGANLIPRMRQTRRLHPQRVQRRAGREQQRAQIVAAERDIGADLRRLDDADQLAVRRVTQTPVVPVQNTRPASSTFMPSGTPLV